MTRGPMLAVLALALALAPGAPPAGAAQPNRFLVVPGRSAGPIDIGMKLDAVERIFGRPSTTDLTSNTHWYEWQAPNNQMGSIAVETAQDTVILISLANDPRYRTSEGLGDGTTLDEVRRVFGQPSSVMRLEGYAILQYRTKGIGFVTPEGSDRVTGIVIAPAVLTPKPSSRPPQSPART